ncbi:GumC family protein [Winogradskyella sp. R77965]|uniref:GumC family protein n=1 Tax=Winogradskyella sp. R77965 TaxID=3093872 RepID=UPI0037DC7452
MESKTTPSSNKIRKTLNLYLRQWKIISFCLFIALAIAYSYLRYTTYKYKATATIKLRDEKQSQKLPSLEEVNKGGLFSDGTNKIRDEIEVITSQTLISNIVKELKLNIRYYNQGQIKEQELYNNPPIKLNFFASDSIIHQVDTTLYLKIKSATEFIMFKNDGKSIIDRNDNEGKKYAFGDRIKTGFGDFVVVPNVDKFAPKVGSNLRVSMNSVRSVASKYQGSIKVATDAGSSVIKIELEDNIPEKAIDVLNQLIREYNDDVIREKEEVVRVTSNFIDNRLQVVSQELEETDFTAEQLQKRNNLTALDSQANLYLESGKQTEAQINATSTTIQLIDYLQEEMQQKNKESDLLPSNIIADPNASQVIKSHNELVAQRDKLLKNSSDKNPVVVNLNNQINALKTNLESSLGNMKRSNEITLNNLNKQDARIRGQIYSAPTKQRQFRDIERQRGIKESLYLYLLEKREESAIRLGMYSPNAKILDKAYSDYMPVAPNKMFTYLAAIMLGLALPIGVIYAKDLMDTKIYDKDDLQDVIDIPYLGDIPKTSKKNKLIKKIDYSPKAEAFRIIRSNIDFMLKDKTNKSKKLFITSTKAQEGKSHTSTNLASSISFSGKSVLLIEMDIRVPKIMQYLNLKPTTDIGLSDYISDKRIKPGDIVNKVKGNEFLQVIPSGTIPPNPSELLMSDRIKELFDYFEDKFDYIVVDTSAVGLVSDTLLVSKYADMFIYVISANNVDRRRLVAVAQPLYKENRLPKMTMLLNGTDFSKKGYGYGYGYGNSPGKKTKKWYQFS